MANGITFVNPHGIEIGDDVYVAHYAWLNGIGGLVMEDEVVVGPFVTISTVNHCRKNGSFRYGGYRAAPVRIGRGSWLAAHVSVAAGVIVGTGCLIAANSVVTRSLPENAVAGGVPAKVLKPCEDSVPSLVSRSGFVASA